MFVRSGCGATEETDEGGEREMRKSRPASQLVEFIIAIALGLLAILGGLLCVGFLLVDPVRNPNGVGDTQPLPDYEGRVCVCANCVLVGFRTRY